MQAGFDASTRNPVNLVLRLVDFTYSFQNISDELHRLGVTDAISVCPYEIGASLCDSKVVNLFLVIFKPKWQYPTFTTARAMFYCRSAVLRNWSKQDAAFNCNLPYRCGKCNTFYGQREVYSAKISTR